MNSSHPVVRLAPPLILAIAATLLLPHAANAEPGLTALTVQNAAGGGQSYSLTLQVLLLMTAVSLLPALLLMMTSFTRIVIVPSGFYARLWVPAKHLPIRSSWGCRYF